MPFQRKDKDGKVVKEYGTEQPTPEQAQKNKQKRIAEQNKTREEFEAGRKKTGNQGAATSAPTKPVSDNSKPAAG